MATRQLPPLHSPIVTRNVHDEKVPLDDVEVLSSDVTQGTRSRRARKYLTAALCSTLGLALFYLSARSPHIRACGSATGTRIKDLLSSWKGDIDASAVCPQAKVISPERNSVFLNALEAEYQTRDFILKAYESLGGAIRVPTVAYDDLKPPGQDERWEIFGDLHAYLEQRFPLLHQNLRKTHVNKYALVYHWQGSNDYLKPTLLTAHQDVVPVEPLTVKEWQHPPFSGLYDGISLYPSPHFRPTLTCLGEYIWGRGSCDDKPGLVGTLTAVEELLRIGFKPARSIVLAYGIDEERGGISGATAIRDYLLKTYGEDAFSILIDEGGGYQVTDDVIISSPAVAEKGKFDVRFEIEAPGGHSSVPPEHTTIGLIAAMIKQLEDNPHAPHLNRSGIYYTHLQCQAAHDPGLPRRLRGLIARARTSDRALAALEEELAATEPRFGALAGTTQAADIVRGGVKTNALPERAEAIVNHRIDVHSSVGALKRRITVLAELIAARYDLKLDAFGETVVEPEEPRGVLKVSDAFGTALEPAPVTPLGESGPFQLLSGTIIGVLGASNRTGYDKKAFVAPGLSTGNTDTKHYWKLTKHIFRYGHINAGDSYNGAHTVNEALRAEGFIEAIRFFTWVILNADESHLLE
ncbi:carboxypeptidase S [Trametes elegans]|nr:carboxypeptidase S [Trametes elegans]